jgi:DNA modification methylase
MNQPSLFPEKDIECRKFNLEPSRPVCKTGDLWHLGNHRLYCGDSGILENTQKLLKGKKCSMAIIDPPYNITYKQSKKAHEYNVKMKYTTNIKYQTNNLSFQDYNIIDTMNIIKKIIDGTNIFVFCNKKQILEYIQYASDLNLSWDIIPFIKTSFVPYMTQLYLNTREWGIHFMEKKITTRVKNRKAANAKGYYIFNKFSEDSIHPANKRVDILSSIMNNSTNVYDGIYDGFCGSGSVMMASVVNHRISYNMEIDPFYCTVALERYYRFSGKEPIRADGMKYLEVKSES